MYDVEFNVSMANGLQSLFEFFELLAKNISDPFIRGLNVVSGKPEAEGRVVRLDVSATLRVNSLQEVEGLLAGYERGKLNVVHVPSAMDGRPFDQIMIEDLDLGVRTYNCLKRGGVQNMAQLLERSEASLATIPNFGRRSIQEVVDFLASKGLQLKQ